MVKTMVSGHKWVLKQTQELSPLVQEKGAFFPEWLNTCKHPHFGLGHLHFLTSIHNTIHHQKTTIFPTINHCKVYKSTLEFTIKPGLEPGLEHVRTITRSRPCCSSSQLSWLLGAPCRTCGTPQRTLRLVPKERSGSRNRAALVKSWLMVEISILLFLVGLTMFFFGRYDLSYTEWGLQTFINQLS